jgi:hypothetical protein
LRKASLAKLQKEADMEQWIPLEIHHPKVFFWIFM